MAPTHRHRYQVVHPSSHSISKRGVLSSRSQSCSVVQHSSRQGEESKLREKELEAIKEHYLGAPKVKKQVTKPSEKFRFSFDWQHTEDTSQDMKPLYERPHDTRLVFGRGMPGARMDRFGMRDELLCSEKKLEEMTERDWRIFQEDHNISCKGSRNCAQPMRNWEESGLPPELLEAVQKIGYEKPSPIQMAAIPIGLQQRDVIGVAETGSGKTAAFVLPLLTYISKLPKMTAEVEAEGPYAVIMAPTRELVLQIAFETDRFSQFLRKSGINTRVVSIVGGQSIGDQSQKLRHGCEIVIATPGRLLDCLERRYAVLNQCNYVVLDEADRMIDMGFEQQVTAVLDAMPKPESQNPNPKSQLHRTTVMFSATMAPAVERIARNYLQNPVVVTIGSAGKATDLITQTVLMLKENEKFDKLQRLLNGIHDQRAIVFVNSRNKAETLTRDLDRNAYRVGSLHGGKTQEQREATLQDFRSASSKLQCLVATDVVGRGIDIPDVAHVVNYNMPETIEKYTHRIGRTGRAGKQGEATTFVTPGDSKVFRDLVEMLVRSDSHVPPELARQCRSR